MLDETHQLALETIQLGKQAIVFVASRSSAEKTAEDISKLTNFSYPDLEQEVLHALSTPTTQCRKLSHCIKKGIAFHHAGLDQKQKTLIEDEFRQGRIKIVCATPTLAAGLSLPAYRVIIKSLKRFSGSWGMDWIPVLEYMQMAGRAGRPEYEKEGQAITMAKTPAEKDEIYKRYLCGVPEEIYSKLAVEPVLRTYLLSLISSGIIRNQTTLNGFFSRTFWAHQFNDMPKLQVMMSKMLVFLEEGQFITVVSSISIFTTGNNPTNTTNPTNNNSFISADNLLSLNNSSSDNSNSSATSSPPETTFHPTILGKKVSELYLDPLTARHLLQCLSNFENKYKNSTLIESQTSFSLLQMISHTLELRPLLNVRKSEEDHVQEELVKHYEQLLEEEPSAYDLEYGEFINSIKTTLFFQAWINEYNEDYMFEELGLPPGEIRGKIEAGEWLLHAAEEMARLSNYRLASKELSKLCLRIKSGVKEELLPMLKLHGIGRVRARRLFSQGIKDIGDIKKADVISLGQILGKAVAEDVKKQVGEDVEQVADGARKGQLSVNKWT